MRKGITGAILSATSLSLDQVAGGAAMMWDLDPAWAEPAVLKPLLQTFVREGGHIFQGNVIDTARLEAAQRDPAAHQDLLVRVGGWSARFVALPEATQNEIITRHKFAG